MKKQFIAGNNGFPTYVRWVCLLIMVGSSRVWAGMPTVRLTHLASLRLSTISFFLAGFLVCAALLAVLWNRVLKDVMDLPRISFRRAVGLLVVWGLLFNVVLTMISGARELLTPQAWEPNGLIHSLRSGGESEDGSGMSLIQSRYQRLHGLGLELWKAARDNDGEYPASFETAGVPGALRQVPGMPGMLYSYCSGRRVDGRVTVLAYEPEGVFAQQFALLTDGNVIELNASLRKHYGLE